MDEFNDLSRGLYVPLDLDQKKEDGWYTGVPGSREKKFPLTADDYILMRDGGLLDDLGSKYHGIFGEYEDAIVDWDLEWLVERVRPLAGECPALLEAAELALKLGTGVLFSL